MRRFPISKECACCVAQKRTHGMLSPFRNRMPYLVGSPHRNAQASAGITGTITDPSGAVIAER